MRFDGILTSWNEASASGIITPGKGGNDIAVHATAFPQGGPDPSVGEALSFEVEIGPDGGKRAHNIVRPRTPPRVAAQYAEARASSSLLTGTLVILAASAALYYASVRHAGEEGLPVSDDTAAMQAPGSAHQHRTDQVAASRFARPAAAPAQASNQAPF